MINNKQKGVSLIMTFFIMLIILTVVISISILLYSGIKVIRNMGNSVVSFYAADSGIEKVLYYDMQVVPTDATRGLCAIFDFISSPTQYCKQDPTPNRPNDEHSIYCNSYSIIDNSTDGTGCSIDKCDNCQIKFSTTFNNRVYGTIATVRPNTANPDTSDFEISSKGIYNSTQRQIQILITPN